ncbi:TetR family transcriptional regulator [Lentzea atacamensis]|uniref:TetR family transcriptional regulator n=2 Tax=Lentzea TaxID=165301 RepID=A0A316HLT8_9PSEU|nr:TetR/AcrR family transcriptional regulator [Lentzea atacamensis]PWK80956.1 TetR family transcriptional regulator [Lentzea atacamensis]
MAPVKPTRAERARQTRRRMIDAARGLFVGQGYAATTMDQIAAEAGVAVQTVYYTFRTKGQLLAEVVEVTAAGEDHPVPVPARAWVREMLSATSGQRVLALGVEHGTAIYERVAALWPAVGAAAAADPAVNDYWRGVTTDRRSGQRAMVARIAELGELRPGLGVDRATDLVVVLVGHDVYHGLVEDARWSVTAYRAWLFTTLAGQLLVSGETDPDAVSGLSFAGLVLGS